MIIDHPLSCRHYAEIFRRYDLIVVLQGPIRDILFLFHKWRKLTELRLKGYLAQYQNVIQRFKQTSLILYPFSFLWKSLGEIHYI